MSSLLPWDIMVLLAGVGLFTGLGLMFLLWNAWPRIDEPVAHKARTHLRIDVARLDANIVQLIDYRRELIKADRRFRKRSRRHGNPGRFLRGGRTRS